MDAQILPRGPKSGLESLFSSIGTGLSQGIGDVLEHKIAGLREQEREKKMAKLLAGLEGNDPQAGAKFFAALSPEERKHYLPNYLAGLGGEQQQGQSIADILGMQQGQQQPQQPQTFGDKYRRGINATKGGGAAGMGGVTLSPVEKARQTQLEKFETDKLKEFDAYKNIVDLAEDMLNILNTNEADFPQNTFTQRILPAIPGGQTLRDAFISGDKAIEYQSKAIDLARLASLTKGVSSNYKAQLDQASKADLSKPISTQKSLLESIIKKGNKRATMGPEYMASLRDPITGLLPNDFKAKVAAFERRPKSAIGNSMSEQIPPELPPIESVKPGKAYIVDTEVWYVDPQLRQWKHIPATPEQLAQNQGG